MTEHSAQSAPAPSRLALLLRAFKHRNYRLFFCGQSVSLVGSWMQTLAMSWLVYRLTGSALLLGVVGFSSQIPALVLAPFSGVLADRFNKHRIIILTQVLAMLQAFMLAALVLSGRIQVWHIVVLSVFLGIVHAFDMPTRQSFIVELVGNKEDLGNAIALNSSMFNGARLIGPSIAGIIISLAGEGLCFLLNGLSYLAVIYALLGMKLEARKKNTSPAELFRPLREGLAYAFGFAPIRYIILLLALISLTAMPYVVLMPVFTKETLHGGPRTLGFLMAFSGAGALTAALTLASRRNAAGLERRIPGAAFLFGLGLIALSFSRAFPAAAVCIAVASFGMITQMASGNTIIQTVVDDDKRGRVMALYSMAFMGMMPFGSLLAGWTASRIGAPGTIMLSGAMALAGAAAFFSRLGEVRENIRPVYLKLGILPGAAAGAAAASGLTAPPED